MKTNYKTIFKIILILFSSATFAIDRNCSKFKSDFTKLYIALQQSLNYEGGDAYYTPGGGITLQKHAQRKNDGQFEGKLFEKMLFEQYQNSLKKVGALLLKAGGKADNEIYGENDIVDFFKKIDANFDPNKNPDIESLVSKLMQKSKDLFIDPIDKNKVINENDKYLLAKLLIHSKDKICSVQKNQTKKGFKDSNLTSLGVYPFNRMVVALKSAKLKGGDVIENLKDSDEIQGEKTKTSRIFLDSKGEIDHIALSQPADEAKTIKSAVLDNLHSFEAWMKAHDACRAFFENSDGQFVQGGIQSCNYKHFVKSLNGSNVTDFEKILHFINTNQKMRLKAETNIDPLLLESYIDSAIKGTKAPACEKIGDVVFARNLKYNGKIFDPKENNFKCTSNKTIVDCSKNIELISDDLGRGIKVMPKNPKIKFEIPGTNCNQDLVSNEGSEPVGPILNGTIDQKTKEEKDKCEKEGKNIFIIITTGNICRAKNESEIKLEKESCEKSGSNVFDSALSGEARCRSKTEKELKDEKEAKEKADKDFKDKCEKDNRKIFDPALSGEARCRAKSEIELNTEIAAEKDKCEKSGKVFDPKAEGEARCRTKKADELTAEQTAEKDKCEKDGKVFDPKAEGEKRCLPKTEESEEAKCEKQNADEIAKDPEQKPIKYFEIKNKRCEKVNRDKKDPKQDGKAEPDEPADPFKDFLNGLSGSKTQTPPRFNPTQIPSRSPGFLMGMP